MKRITIALALVLSLVTAQGSLSASADAPLVDFTSWGTPSIERSDSISVGSGVWGDEGTGWPAGTAFQVEWLRDGITIPNAALFLYTPTEEDRGHHLSFRVTGSLDGYNNKTVTSARSTYMVAPITTVSGEYLVGKTLTASTPAIAGVTYKYQWYRSYGSIPIPGATKSTFKIPESMVLDNVTAVANAFENGVQVSQGELLVNNLTSITGGKHVEAKFKVSLSGSVMVDRTLYGHATNANNNVGRGECTNYWLRDGRISVSDDIGSTSYTPVAADVGHTITFKMVCVFPGRKGSTTKTAVSRKIVKAPLFEGTPSVTGTTTVGSIVTAQVQELMGQHWTPGTNFSYQWLKDGKKIAGATSSTYLIPEGFATHKISVTVTGSKPGYTTQSMTSAKILVTQ